MSIFTIYTYGNFGVLYNILTSMSMFFYQNGSVAGFMSGMVRMASIIAILTVLLQWVGLTMHQKGNGFDLLFFVRFYLLYAFLVMTPTYKTLIVDSTVGDGVTDLGGIPVNMPLPMGVIFINSVTSTIFHQFIVGYQKYFGLSSNPDINYSRSGLAFGSAFISNLPGYNFGSTELQQNYQTYITHCALPIIFKNGGLTSLMSNNNLASALDIGTAGNNRWVNYTTSAGTNAVVSCNTAYKNIMAAIAVINPIKEAEKQSGAADVSKSQAPAEFTQAQSQKLSVIFLNSLNTTAEDFTGSSQTGSDLMKQAMTINMVRQGIRREAAQYDATATANAAYDAIQFQQYQAGSQLSGEQAGRVVPALQNFAFTLLFMLYPVLVLMALLTSSFSSVIKYVQFSATIACIPFIYELLNSVIYMYGQGHNGELARSGLTMMNSASIYYLNSNIVAAANYLSMATPAVAYMIISGSSMAITSVMGHSTQPAQSQASNVGQQQAHGDMRAGQFAMDTQTYNTVSANKFNDRPEYQTGDAIYKNQVGSTNFSKFSDGTVTADQAKSNLVTSANMNSAVTKQVTDAYNHAKQNSASIGETAQQSAQQTYDWLRSRGYGEQAQAFAGDMRSNGVNVGAKGGVSGGKNGNGVSATGGIDVHERLDAGAKKTFSSDDKATFNQKYNESIQNAKLFQKANQETQALLHASQYASSNQYQVSTDLGNKIVEGLTNLEHGNMQAVNNDLKNMNTPQGMEKLNQVIGQYKAEIVNDVIKQAKTSGYKEFSTPTNTIGTVSDNNETANKVDAMLGQDTRTGQGVNSNPDSNSPYMKNVTATDGLDPNNLGKTTLNKLNQLEDTLEEPFRLTNEEKQNIKYMRDGSKNNPKY